MSALIIHTRGDGVLGDTSPEQLAQIAGRVAAAPHTVLHFHGGLVKKKSATAMAERLAPFYSQAGLLPIFFVWESGLVETIRNNASEIFDEKIFRVLLKRVLKWAGGKMLDPLGGRAGTTAEPLDDGTVETAVAEARMATDEAAVPKEPLAELPEPAEVAPLKTAEEEKFVRELRESQEFREAFDGLMLGLGTEAPPGRAVGVTAPQKSLISESVKAELRDTATEGQRGLFDPATLVVRAAAVLARVVRRLATRRGHGLYTTVVEELLRELYVDAIGTWVWGRMKQDTHDTFQPAEPGTPRGGRLFIEELGKAMRAAGTRPRISIVGHSAGSIFASHLLAHVDEQRRAGALPGDFRFHRIAFLAPACQCALWNGTLQRHAAKPLWDGFRMYSLSDKLEAGYWEAPPLYPRSLLYMISGILEVPEFDMPLLGMQRYLDRADVYKMPEVAAARTFLSGNGRQVWSEVDQDLGLRADSVRHGAFDETTGARIKTMGSVAHFLTH